MFRNVSESIQELTQMHLFALEQGIESGDNWILVLEDDVILNTNYYNSTTFLIELASQLHPRQSIVFLNSSRDLPHKFRTRRAKSPKDTIYLIKPPTVRNSCSYLISRDAAILTVNFAKGFSDPLPSDYLLQVAARFLQIQTYWQEPPFFLQGSELGFYNSNLEGNRYN